MSAPSLHRESTDSLIPCRYLHSYPKGLYVGSKALYIKENIYRRVILCMHTGKVIVVII